MSAFLCCNANVGEDDGLPPKDTFQPKESGWTWVSSLFSTPNNSHNLLFILISTNFLPTSHLSSSLKSFVHLLSFLCFWFSSIILFILFILCMSSFPAVQYVRSGTCRRLDRFAHHNHKRLVLSKLPPGQSQLEKNAKWNPSYPTQGWGSKPKHKFVSWSQRTDDYLSERGACLGRAKGECFCWSYVKSEPHSFFVNTKSA